MDWDGYTGVIPKTSATIAEVLRHYGYKHGGVRQVAQHAGRPDHGDGPVRPLAHRPRLRLLLRLPGRRDLAVGAAAGREHQRHRAAARPEVPPERRPGAARRRLAAPAPRLRARQALPPVLGAGRRARAAPDPQGMGRQVQGPVRRRLGRLPRARVRAPEAAGLDPGRHEAHAARRVDAGMEQHSRVAAPVPAPADGDLRRLRRACRRAGRQADRRARAPGHPRQHHRHLHLRRQRRQRRRARTARSASCWRRTASPTRSSSSSRRWTRSAASTRWAARRPTACTTPAGPGPATRRSGTPSWSPRTSAARATRWSSPGPRASSPTRTPRAQFSHVNDIVPTLYEVIGIKPPKVVDGFKQDPIDGISLAYTFKDAKAPTRKKRAVLRQQRQPRDLPGRLGRGHLRPAGALAARRAGSGRVGFGQGQVGALRHHARTSRRPTTWRRRTRSAWRSCRRPSTRRRTPTRSIRSAPASGCACTPRTASRRPTRSWHVRRDHDAHARVHRAGPGPREQHRDHRCRVRRQRLGRALCAGRLGRRADAVHGQGPAGLRVQHDDHRALHRALGRASCRPASTASRSRPRWPAPSRCRRPRWC